MKSKAEIAELVKWLASLKKEAAELEKYFDNNVVLCEECNELSEGVESVLWQDEIRDYYLNTCPACQKQYSQYIIKI